MLDFCIVHLYHHPVTTTSYVYRPQFWSKDSRSLRLDKPCQAYEQRFIVTHDMLILCAPWSLLNRTRYDTWRFCFVLVRFYDAALTGPLVRNTVDLQY